MAEVDHNGAVLLGESVCCDADASDRSVRVVTHAHSDHLLSLGKSLRHCEMVLMTPVTKDLIDVLKGSTLCSIGNVRRVIYEEPTQLGNERITLLPADHIVGAAQVLVEDREGNRLLYTGDFKLPNTPIIESDELVIEATYGNPACVRPFKNSVEERLVNLVERALKTGPTYIFGYHGKLQETIGILRRGGVEAPIIMPETVYKIAKVCEKYGMRLGECFMSKSDEAREIMRTQPYIGVYHMGSRRYVGRDAVRILLSGWEFLSPVRRMGEKEYVVALSDHSDFEQLIEYVEKSGPRRVVTDNYRVGGASLLAKEITKRLRIPAIPMP